jgi:hypothetical protein
MGAGTSVVYLAPQPGTGNLRITRAITAEGNMSADLASAKSCDIDEITLSKGSDSGC